MNRLPLVLAIVWLLTGCASNAAAPEPAQASQPPQATPQIPDKLSLDENGQPELNVYITSEGRSKAMAIESYVAGVLAGEMENDWPLEALKAQAVLARTFVLKFAAEKESRYAGADISTDISEAQAYNEAKVNDRIEQAIGETQGIVMAYGQELPYAWFHAHSGGTTALAREGLGYQKDEPPYTQVVKGQESPEAPDDAKAWEAAFGKDEFLAACRKAGAEVNSVSSLSIGDYGESGRALTLLVDDTAVSAPELRMALGSAKMRSTLLTSLKIDGSQVRMAGKGYGHGVGMPQWGAYGLAQAGKRYDEIVAAYFKDVTLVKLW